MDALVVRPLLCCPDAVRAELSARVAAAWTGWCADWGLPCAGVHANHAAEEAAHDPRLAWQPLRPTGEGGAWLGAVDMPPSAAVGAWLFGRVAMQRGKGNALAREVAERACIDLSEALALALPHRDAPFAAAPAAAAPAAASPPLSESGSWSGAVRLRLRLREEPVEMMLHLAPEIPQRLPPTDERHSAPRLPAAPRVPVDRAAAACPVRLRVELGDVEIDLHSLAELRAGDVVALAHRLDEPLIVRLAPDPGDAGEADASASPPACLASLGSRHGRRAVQVMRGVPSRS